MPPDGSKFTRSKEPKQSFKNRWESSFAHIVNKATTNPNPIFACGDWLQRDDLFEDRYFAGMLFWDSGVQNKAPLHLMDSNVHIIAIHMVELVNDAAVVVSSMTKPLQHLSPHTVGPQDTDSSEILQVSNIKHPAFKPLGGRIYDTTAATGFGYEDQ
ncbi:hypothetical protein N7463_000422 [Penicillium fimorum]|uniref:Uncharacterized protein n=1 Tax=Penicillium fimorum TaxID=1882269 RepID=A0A9W9Y483_9EURO|nr:hypothetical protein N7463_000422 [Penicillium fimorum]